jgi:hypothetical protein
MPKFTSSRTLLTILAGTFFLLVAAFYNGFPIVYADSSTYISSIHSLAPPVDRPITYGLLAGVLSLYGVSLWLVVVAQAVLTAWLVTLLYYQLANGRAYHAQALLGLGILGLATGASWTISQVMPDIFTAIGLLLIANLLINRISKATRNWLIGFFVLAVAVHSSHIVLFSGLLIVLLLLRKRLAGPEEIRMYTRRVALLLALTLATIATMGAALSKSRHVFFMGAMVEHGIVKTFLDEQCGAQSYALCAYKDQLPERAWQFVWNQDSPLYKLGGWKATKPEFNRIFHATLTQPRYQWLHVKASVLATADQLAHFAMGDGNGVFLQGTLLNERMARYYPYDYPAYRASRQNDAALTILPLWNAIAAGTFLASWLALGWLLYRSHQRLTPAARLTAVVFLLGILANAWTSGTLANALDRLGCKTTWLFTLLALLVYFDTRRRPAASPQ